jgi:hypothetical protein
MISLVYSLTLVSEVCIYIYIYIRDETFVAVRETSSLVSEVFRFVG